MQDIVYKLVPGLYKSKCFRSDCIMRVQDVTLLSGEQKKREEFYRERGEVDPSKLAYMYMYHRYRLDKIMQIH